MEGGGGEAQHYNNPHTVVDVFNDFKGRRTALIKALTTDAEEFFERCHPDKDNLCLYGFPNGQWEVNIHNGEIPPDLPEPTLGINFPRDNMNKNRWFSLISLHSDTWLLSVAFYFAAIFGFDKNDRNRLFNMIHDLPTILEVVTGALEEQVKNNSPGKKSQSNLKARESESQPSQSKDDKGETLCGACGENYESDEFRICCEICEKWFHGKCVKISPARAEHSKQRNKCLSCSNKRARK